VHDLRRITVDDERFTWRIARLDAHHVGLRIWRADDKRLPWADVRIRCDDGWLLINDPERDSTRRADAPVTPSLVATIIRARRAHTGRDFEWLAADSVLSPITA
jgi:hypothetical protein